MVGVAFGGHELVHVSDESFVRMRPVVTDLVAHPVADEVNVPSIDHDAGAIA